MTEHRPSAKPKRWSKGRVRALAWVTGTATFLAGFGILGAAPKPSLGERDRLLEPAEAAASAGHRPQGDAPRGGRGSRGHRAGDLRADDVNGRWFLHRRYHVDQWRNHHGPRRRLRHPHHPRRVRSDAADHDLASRGTPSRHVPSDGHRCDPLRAGRRRLRRSVRRDPARVRNRGATVLPVPRRQRAHRREPPRRPVGAGVDSVRTRRPARPRPGVCDGWAVRPNRVACRDGRGLRPGLRRGPGRGSRSAPSPRAVRTLERGRGAARRRPAAARGGPGPRRHREGVDRGPRRRGRSRCRSRVGAGRRRWRPRDRG